MGYDNNLMVFFRDGANEGVALTILGSLRSLQQQYPTNLHNTSPRILAPQHTQQTDGDNMMIDGAAATRDRDRERVNRRCSRNVDVRYMKSLRYLRERLNSSYSCSGRRCPIIQERFEQHQLELHSSSRKSAPKRDELGCNSDNSRAASRCAMIKKCFGQHQLESHPSAKPSVSPEDESKERKLDKTLMITPAPDEEFVSTGNESKIKNQTEFYGIEHLLFEDNDKINTPRHIINKRTSIKDLVPHEIATVSVGTDQFTVSKVDNCNYFGSNTNNRNDEYIKNHSTNTDTTYDYKEIKGIDQRCSYNTSGISLKNNVKEIMGQDEATIDSNIITYGVKSVDKSSSAGFEKTVSMRSNERRKTNKHAVQTEVREWIRKLPMYPGLGRKDKEEKENALNNLISNLNKLIVEPINTEFEHKARKEIYACLDKLSLWYPTNLRDRITFRNDLCVRLFERLIKICKMTIKKSNNKDVVTTVNSAVGLPNQMFKSDKLMNTNEIKKTIIEWLWLIYQKTESKNIVENISKIADFIIVRVNPLLNKCVGSNNYKLILETALVNIISELPINISWPKNKTLHIQQFAEDLADRLLSVQAQFVNCNRKTNILTDSASVYNNDCGFETSVNNQKKPIIYDELRKCFENANFHLEDFVKEEAGAILLDLFTKPDPDKEKKFRNELIDLLVTIANLSKAQAIHIIDVVIENLKSVINEGNIIRENTKSCNKFKQPITSSVYTSIEEPSLLNYPLTSTPKKKLPKKTISKLNPQEIQYMEKIANLIRAWMITLPESFDAPEEKNFKETMIYDLAGDIMDEAKLEQLTPGTRSDRHRFLKYYVARWIYRLGAFEVEDVDPQIETFLAKLQEIPVPIMIQPQHGNRQAMANIKYQVDASWHDNFLPKGTDIIEDEISIWINEQPSNIYINNEKEYIQNKIRELAQILEIKLKNKTEISSDIAKWLNNIIKPEIKRDIDELTENLKHRVIDLPQEATLAAKLDRKLKEKADYKTEMEEHVKEKSNLPTDLINKNETTDQENTMKLFISKFIEHNYDVDDPLARRAFNRLLRTHLQRINPPVTRKEIYDNFRKNKHDDRFPPQKLVQELEYIKDISDWLKNLPVNASYNTLGNRDRIDFVNSLAISIREIEEEHQNNPDAMNYESYMGYMILEYIHLLPIPEEYCKNISFMINQLLTKIITHREAVAAKLNESANTTGVNTENFGDFIEEFIRINGDDIAQDEVKLEVWAIRLIREVKKMVQTTSRPSVLSKGYIYKKLADVPIPGDETANIFSLELDYVKEITDWLKNLPLLPVNELEKDNRTKMICRLAEKITEMEKNKTISPSDTRIDDDFKEYVAKWISKFPLNKKQEIVLPIAIEQLMNRIKKIKQKDVLPDLNFCESCKTSNDSCKQNKIKELLSQTPGKNNQVQKSSNLMVNVIEKWVNELSLKESSITEDAKTNIKIEISRKLFQTVSQLNIDPKTYNDDLLYQEMLIDEIDLIFENLPLDAASQNNTEKLKTDLIHGIIEAKNNIKEKIAGDAYKRKLENTIEASIPNPVSINHVYEPGFELYKGRLATMFILENFDHGTDLVKIKYEKLLKKEIDKYFDNVKNKNALPISKDQLYLELYRNLFKVPIPNEASIIEEVEEIKTRCEIDTWFEELPMREATDLNELLEWDKILSTLAKRIHDIETSQSLPDQEILKEIMKWLVKLPLRTENESKLKEYAAKLQERLKSTVAQRKCVLDDSKSIKSKKGKEKEKPKESSAKKVKEDSAGPSSNGKMWTSSCVQAQQLSESKRPRKKAADEIFEIVQAWCSQIPISANTPNDAQMLKDNLMTKIIVKIGQLNTNQDTFNNQILYDKFLDEELELLISTLPTTCDFQNSYAARKYQLIEAIKEVKPLLLEERANHKFKQELKKYADKILEKPSNLASDEEAIFDELRNEIIDDFIQYEYSKNDDESRQVHKKNIQNNIFKLVGNIENNRNEPNLNFLMKTNLTICELATVSVKFNKNLVVEIEEIQMKKEISVFFSEFILSSKSVDKVKLNYLKESLAKKLNEIEIDGHTLENESKMKLEIVRCLNKLNMEINHADIDAFVIKLKNNEMVRRKPQMANRYDESGVNKCQKVCKRSSHILGNQNLETGSAHQIPDDISVNCARSTALASTNDLHTLENQSKDFENTTVSSDRQSCGKNLALEVENLENKVEEEENTCDYEDEKKCPCCGKLKGYRRIPYCMVPMRPLCECYVGVNPYWCKMPLAGFYNYC